MSKIRINDLARELEVKSKAILDVLTAVGVTEKKTHSSSIEDHEAEKVRIHLRGSAEASSPSAKSARPLRGEEEIKTKIDLSNISRPGDVLKAITQQKEAVAPPARPACAARDSAARGSTAAGSPAHAASGCAIYAASGNACQLRLMPSRRRLLNGQLRLQFKPPAPSVVVPPRPAAPPPPRL